VIRGVLRFGLKNLPDSVLTALSYNDNIVAARNAIPGHVAMKALTISQPFASLIARREKFVENRNWSTSYRGPLAIHAGKGTQYLTATELRQYLTGGVIAVAELVGCLRLDGVLRSAHPSKIFVARGSGITFRDVIEHEHSEGPWCWVLSNVTPVEFFPCRGEQGLWNVELTTS
jgi:hypothetical protein